MKAKSPSNKGGTAAAPAPLTNEQIEDGADLSAFMDTARPAPPALEPVRVNVDFPAWVVGALDAEADRIGVTRQSIIKLWLVERLERAGSTRRQAGDEYEVSVWSEKLGVPPATLKAAVAKAGVIKGSAKLRKRPAALAEA